METEIRESYYAIAESLLVQLGDAALSEARTRALAHVEAGEDEGATLWWAVADAIAALRGSDDTD